MWNGRVTQELIELHSKYLEYFGNEPDEYAEIFYDAMSYEEYISYIRKCLEEKVEIPDVVQ